MPSHIDELLDHIAALERELETELDRARTQWRYRIEAGRIRFTRDVWLAHKRVKQSVPRFLRMSSPLNLLTGPVVYSMIVPIVLIDVWISLYQAICFRAYGIARRTSSTGISSITAMLDGYRRRLMPLRNELKDGGKSDDS